MLLVLIMGFLTIMSIIGFASRTFTSQVTNQVARLSFSTTCVSLAESAIQEAMHQVMVSGNEPGTDLFKALREPVYAPQRGNLDLTDGIHLKVIHQILDRKVYDGFDLDDLKVRVEYQRQFQNLPYERHGLIIYQATAEYDLSLTDSIKRTVEMAQEFRVTLLSPPRPFDQPTFMTYLDSPQRDLQLDEVDQAHRLYLSKVRDVLALAKAYRGGVETPPSVKTLYDEIETTLQPPNYWQQFVKPFPTDPCVLFSTKGEGEELALASLDLPPEIERAESAVLQPAREEMTLAMGALAGDLRSIGNHERMVIALKGMASGLDEVMNRFKDFYGDWRFWTDEKYESMNKFRYKLYVEHWQDKAHIVIRPPIEDEKLPIQRISPEDQLKHILRTTRPVNAIILVDLRETQFKNRIHRVFQLDGAQPEFARIQGRTVLVFYGPVHVRNVNRIADKSDMLTIVGLKQEVTVEGEVHASFVTSESAPLILKPDTRIHGSVMCEKLPPKGERAAVVVREKKYDSGYTTHDDDTHEYRDYYHLGVVPGYLYKRVIP